MAENRQLFNDADYLANRDNAPLIDPTADQRRRHLESGKYGTELGYYQRTHLEDIINNFIVSHVGPDKVLTKIPRHEVAFWAQRAVQEFSYDIFHADKAIEIELNPNRTIPLPNDFVNIVKITHSVRETGVEIPLYPAPYTTATQSILQDDQFEYNYDADGQILYGEPSVGVGAWRETDPGRTLDYFQNYYYGSDYDGEYDYYTYYYNQGRRYGSNPIDLNGNPEYVLDLFNGLIYIGNRLNAGDLIIIRYVSDGLTDNGDLTQVYVPKLAEDAIYASILYNLSKLRPSSAQAAPLYKKEAMAKMRNAKHRLTNYRLEEMTQVMRGKSKWIKH